MINAILNPALLFFITGILVGSIFTRMQPAPFVSKYLGYYLLLSLGLKGGFSLQKTGFITEVTNVLSLGVLFALLIPFCSYLYLRNILNNDDAAALAGTYGSVSAVTFVTANTYLTGSAQVFDDYMSAVLVVMEFPAIFMALYLVRKNNGKGMRGNLDTIKSAFLELPNIILLTSLFAGYLLIKNATFMFEFLTIDIFEYVLILFLFVMGLGVSKLSLIHI